MAYEVTKTIAGRRYRYRVESIRDAQTGRRRNRWTYLGRELGPVPAAPRPPRGDARERLLDALERLLDRTDFAALTAGAIATEAGLAHGTFYRHFPDKAAALSAALDRVRERAGGGPFALLAAPPSDREAARETLRGVVEVALRTPADHPALLRATYALALRDPEAARERRERRERHAGALERYLADLADRGLAGLDDPGGTARALLALLDGFYREAVVDGVGLDEPRIAAAAAVVDRAVFGEIARREAP